MSIKGPVLTKKQYDMALNLGMTGGTLGPSVGMAAAPYVKPAIAVARRIGTTLIRRWIRAGFKRFQTVRPGIGSKVTKGPLRIGKQVVYGKAKPGIGRAAVAGAGVAAAGISAIASHRPTLQTQTRPQPARAPQAAPSQKDERKCCPLGTKRMVCFKRGRVKKRKPKPRKAAKPKKAKPRKRKSTRKRRR